MEVEYVEKLAAPWPEKMMLQNDWVSSIAVSSNWYVSLVVSIKNDKICRGEIFFTLILHSPPLISLSLICNFVFWLRKLAC